MPSKEFMRKLYIRRLVEEQQKKQPWHFENPDCSPLCFAPGKTKWWDGGAPKNAFRMNTTANVKYVTCLRCRKILADRGVELPELIKEVKE